MEIYMTIQEMRDKKKEMGYTYAQIADLSGVPLGTVQKIFSGETESPRYDTILALEQLFRDIPVVRESSSYKSGSRYERNGSYTLDDYYALPDEQRVELIDGYFSICILRLSGTSPSVGRFTARLPII